jgi:hypothetical protein
MVIDFFALSLFQIESHTMSGGRGDGKKGVWNEWGGHVGMLGGDV